MNLRICIYFEGSPGVISIWIIPNLKKNKHFNIISLAKIFVFVISPRHIYLVKILH